MPLVGPESISISLGHGLTPTKVLALRELRRMFPVKIYCPKKGLEVPLTGREREILNNLDLLRIRTKSIPIYLGFEVFYVCSIKLALFKIEGHVSRINFSHDTVKVSLMILDRFGEYKDIVHIQAHEFFWIYDLISEYRFDYPFLIFSDGILGENMSKAAIKACMESAVPYITTMGCTGI